jgi:hypothetical protein
MGILGSYQSTEYRYEDDLPEGNCASHETQSNDATYCNQSDQPLYGPILLIGSRTLDFPIPNRCSS